mmetsp:Transcript_6863/g.20139  ORF Transcript_6863/g.20139 Transcript_6863/m.20139 type:complete len:218 (-) Transcript_6863:23-676(-)
MDDPSILATINRTVAKRNKARGKKLWSVADELRGMLGDLGVVIQDTSPTTSEWRWKKGAIAAADDESDDDDGGAGDDDDESEAPPPAPVAKPSKKRASSEDGETKTPKKRKTFPGGLVATIVKPGSGKAARPKKKVTMQYVGTLASNGRQFDSGKITFKLGAGDVIRGWDVGCAGMVVGERRQLFIPSKMGYGSSGAPPDIPPHADLNFDCTLLKAS